MEIIYENETALMTFDYRQTMELLQRRIRSYQVPEDIKLLQFISQSSELVITINSDHPLANRFCYLTFDLISAGQGIILCKDCCRQYEANDLTIKGTSTIQKTSQTKKLKKFLMHRFNMKEKLNTPGFGMKQLLCPQQHVLFCVRTWIT